MSASETGSSESTEYGMETPLGSLRKLEGGFLGPVTTTATLELEAITQ